MPKVFKMIDNTDKYIIKKENIFSLPFRVVICGSSGMGKTSLLANLLLREDFYKNDFAKHPENIFIFSGSMGETKMKTILEELEIPKSNQFRSYEENELEKILDKLMEDYDMDIEMDQHPKQSLIVLDDLSYTNMFKSSKINSQLDRLYCNGRKYLISCITICQKYTQLNTCCRENLSGAIIGMCTNKQLATIEDDFNFLPTKKDFNNMVREHTKGAHDFIIFNMHNKHIYQDKDFNDIQTVDY